jgi:serine/threonine protein kinase
MGTFPGNIFKKTFGRLFARKSPTGKHKHSRQDKEDTLPMNSTELETSGLQEKTTATNLPALPDGSSPIPLGSGVITGILGEGGSAVIYEIRNKQLGLQRAVKLLKPRYTRDTYNRFIREFRISIQLSHPNLAVVHTIGQWNKLPFIEMERITGFTLSEIVAQFGPLPTGLVSAIGIILCKSLEYLHSCTYEIDKKNYRGLLHLDLKPSNILLSDSGVLKIMDFGLSTPAEEVRLGNYPKAGVGSTQYIAPELLLGQAPPDGRSDIYSLGCILYELLSGVKTFPGPEEESVLELRQTNTYVSLKKLSKAIPSSLIQLIEECLNLKKDNRPLNIESIRKGLEQIHQSVTRLTPENTIQMYVTQRKRNEPFSLPRPFQSIQSLIVKTFIVLIVLGLIGTAAFLGIKYNYLPIQYGTSKSATTASDNTKKKNEPVADEDNPVQKRKPPEKVRNEPDEVDFYAPAINSSQSALMDSIRLAWSTRKFDIMLSLINRLPPELAQSKEVVLYKLRSLGRSGEELGKILEKNEVLDAE